MAELRAAYGCARERDWRGVLLMGIILCGRFVGAINAIVP